MSEEFLKALMQLFALAVKQDGGIPSNERAWVLNFLDSQTSDITASRYMKLFDHLAGPLTETEPVASSAFPTVRDSLRILNICEAISFKLTQEQKVVALIRLYELVYAGYQFTPQRINILNTVAEVFRISSEEFTSIEKFIRDDDPMRQNQAVLFLEQGNGSFRPVPELHGGQETSLIILHIASTDLFFLRLVSDVQSFLNEYPLRKGPVYTLNRSSAVRTSGGTILNFSEISSFYNHEKHQHTIHVSAEHVSLKGKDPLKKVSFTMNDGCLTGIIGNEQSGRSALLRIIHGSLKPAAGSLKINGNDAASLKNQLSLAGYVPRYPAFTPNLTVTENLGIAISGFDTGSPAQTSSLIKRAISESGLVPVKDSKAHSLSPEQSKRLDIAMEAVRKPDILLLEDPFTGLSSSQAFSIMCYLRDLTRGGKLVVVSCGKSNHDIFHILDDILILDHGYLVYRGAPSGAMEHFRKLGNLKEPVCPACGNFNTETVFRIIEAPAIDELGNKTDERMVSPARWAALFNTPPKPVHTRKTKENIESIFRKKDLKGQILAFAATGLKRKTASFKHYSLLVLFAFSTGALASVVSEIIQPDPKYTVFSLVLALAILSGILLGVTEYLADRINILRNIRLGMSMNVFFLLKAVFIVATSAAILFIMLLGGNMILIVHSMFANWLLLTIISSTVAAVIYGVFSFRLLRVHPHQP